MNWHLLYKIIQMAMRTIWQQHKLFQNTLSPLWLNIVLWLFRIGKTKVEIVSPDRYIGNILRYILWNTSYNTLSEVALSIMASKCVVWLGPTLMLTGTMKFWKLCSNNCVVKQNSTQPVICSFLFWLMIVRLSRE